MRHFFLPYLPCSFLLHSDLFHLSLVFRRNQMSEWSWPVCCCKNKPIPTPFWRVSVTPLNWTFPILTSSSTKHRCVHFFLKTFLWRSIWRFSFVGSAVCCSISLRSAWRSSANVVSCRETMIRFPLSIFLTLNSVYGPRRIPPTPDSWRSWRRRLRRCSCRRRLCCSVKYGVLTSINQSTARQNINLIFYRLCIFSIICNWMQMFKCIFQCSNLHWT